MDAQLQNAATNWAELSPSEHVVQFYDSTATLIESLDTFVITGILANEATIVIAVPEHIASLETRMRERGIDLVAARWKGLYFPVDAESLLAEFMVNGMPDEQAFRSRIKVLLELAGRHGRKVRGFGEMVAILLGRGNRQALLRLEQLWTAICREESIKLFCAYPSSGFGADDAETFQHVCAAHTHVLGSPERHA